MARRLANPPHPSPSRGEGTRCGEGTHGKPPLLSSLRSRTLLRRSRPSAEGIAVKSVSSTIPRRLKDHGTPGRCVSPHRGDRKRRQFELLPGPSPRFANGPTGPLPRPPTAPVREQRNRRPYRSIHPDHRRQALTPRFQSAFPLARRHFQEPNKSLRDHPAMRQTSAVGVPSNPTPCAKTRVDEVRIRSAALPLVGPSLRDLRCRRIGRSRDLPTPAYP